MPSLPVGTFVQIDRADTVYGREVAVHPDDVLPGVLTSAGSDNGCCGSDGLDGPNRACACGTVIATEQNDCWTRAEIRFLCGRVAEH